MCCGTVNEVFTPYCVTTNKPAYIDHTFISAACIRVRRLLTDLQVGLCYCASDAEMDPESLSPHIHCRPTVQVR